MHEDVAEKMHPYKRQRFKEEEEEEESGRSEREHACREGELETKIE